MPTPHRLLLSLKLYIAAILALYIAFSQSFTYPYWTMMTVYILALDSSGAMRQKWMYMLGGTIVGASMGVLCAFAMATSQLAMLISECALFAMAGFFALRDRLPSFYAFMIGGVSCFLVALPGLSTPDVAVSRAIERVQDITVGAVCLFAVDSLIFPSGVTGLLRKAMTAWIGHLRVLTVAVLRGQPTPLQARDGLLGQASSLDPIASYLPFEVVSHGARRRRSADAIRTRGLRTLPLLNAIEDLDRHLNNAARPRLDMPLREALAAWIESGAPASGAPALHAALRTGDLNYVALTADSTTPDSSVHSGVDAGDADADPADSPLSAPQLPKEDTSHTGDTDEAAFAEDPWMRLLRRSQRRTLRALFAGWSLIAADIRNLQARKPVRAPLPEGTRPTPSSLTQLDIGYTLRVVFALLMHLGTFTVLWSSMKWVSGYAAFGMLLSSVFFVASGRSDYPVIVLTKISKIVGISLLIVAIYVTLIFPHTSNLLTVAIALAPALLYLGTVVPNPGNVLFAVLPMAMLRLGNNGPSVNLPSLINSGAGLLIGLCSALLWMIVIVRLPAGGALRRLWKENGADLRDVLRGAEPDAGAFAWRSVDRFILIFRNVPPASKPDAEPDKQGDATQRAMRELRVGVSTAVIRTRTQSESNTALHGIAKALVNKLVVRFKHPADSSAVVANDGVLDLVDELLVESALQAHAAPDIRHPHDIDRIQTAAVDLRLALFPDARAPTLYGSTQTPEPM